MADNKDTVDFQEKAEEPPIDTGADEDEAETAAAQLKEEPLFETMEPAAAKEPEMEIITFDDPPPDDEQPAEELQQAATTEDEKKSLEEGEQQQEMEIVNFDDPAPAAIDQPSYSPPEIEPISFDDPPAEEVVAAVEQKSSSPEVDVKPAETPDVSAPEVEEVLFDDPEPEPVKPEPVVEQNADAEDLFDDPEPVIAPPVASKPKVEAKTYDIEIFVSDPHKVGEGVGSYMAYKLKTITSLPSFKNSEMMVDRRFSDFLGLHEKLLAKHRHVGHIVPPAPPKNVVGMTMVKMSKSEEEATAIDFVEKRRAALERYMNRLVLHEPIVLDQDLRDFLEIDVLPQATSTRALSGAGMMRLMKNVEGAFNKMTIKMVEEDSWYEEKQQQIDSLEFQLRKLHGLFESLVRHRKELANNTASFAKSSASLGNAEEHTALSRALAQLSDAFEKLETTQQDQANKDFFHVSEILSDYIGLIEEIKEVFMVRVKSWQTWQNAENNVQRKREAEMKLQQTGGNPDKMRAIQTEIEEGQNRVVTSKGDFEAVSVKIKESLATFEQDRIADFKKLVMTFLKNLLKSQEQNIKVWEAFLPEARAIA